MWTTVSSQSDEKIIRESSLSPLKIEKPYVSVKPKTYDYQIPKHLGIHFQCSVQCNIWVVISDILKGRYLAKHGIHGNEGKFGCKKPCLLPVHSQELIWLLLKTLALTKGRKDFIFCNKTSFDYRLFQISFFQWCPGS